ncbi:10 TM domain-containing transmembrane protein yfiS [Acrasis kona]|uniref:10 TM domain-containing transmembrane protein yfiS n=1 Tax=Acrasis kona TaxID=1008807 RepID=A0AAW2YKI1_9EUKA
MSFLPPIIFLPVTGPLSDVFDRRKIMLASDVLRAIFVLGYLFVLIDVHKYYWGIYIVCGINWSFNSFFDPSREGLVPVTIPKHLLVTSNALEALTWLCCAFIGSFFGGFITSLAGPGVCFSINSVTFLCSSLCVLQLFRYSSLKPEAIHRKMLTTDTSIEEEKSSNIFIRVAIQLREFYFGILFLLKHPYVLTLVLIKGLGAINFTAMDFVVLKMCFEVFQPTGQIRDASKVYGIIRAVAGVVAGFAPVFIERCLPKGYGPKTMRTIIVLGFCAMVPAYAIIVAYQNLWTYVVATMMIACASGCLWIFSNSCIQMVTPNNFLGRTISMDTGFSLNLAQSVALLTYGPLLYDYFRLKPFQIAIFQICVAGTCAFFWIIWFIVTRNVVHEIKEVDRRGSNLEIN